MKKRIISTILMTALLFGVTACGKTDTKITANTENGANGTENVAESSVSEDTAATEAVSQDLTVRIAYNGGIYSITDVGFNSAFFTGHLEEELNKIGVDFEILNFENGAAVNEALLTNEIDIVNSMGDQPLVLAIANGIDVAGLGVLSSSGANMGIVVAPDSGITSIEQLAGKRIACSIGSTGHKYVINILSEAGLTQDDIELVNLSDETSQIAALSRGEIDAAVMITNLNNAEEDGIGTVLETPDVPSYIFIESTGSFVSEHADVVQVYVDSIKWGEEWYRNNQEEYYKLAGDYWNLEVEEVKGYFGGESTFDANMPENITSYLKNTADFLLSQDIISEKLTEEEISSHLYNFFK